MMISGTKAADNANFNSPLPLSPLRPVDTIRSGGQSEVPTNEHFPSPVGDAPSPNAVQPDIILLVDDSPINLRMLFDALGNAGFKLLAAESGEVALEQVKICQPNIILLDVMMPGMDGFETCRRLKADPLTADIPIIFMTALADTVNKIQGLTIGAVDYITKPIQPDEVLARIRTHLMVAHLRHQLQGQNAQLRQEIQERKQIEQSLKLLLRGVSHDLRNPVNGMIMVLNNMLGELSPSVSGNDVLSQPRSDVVSEAIAVPRQTLERMVMSCDRQLQLINSLLETHTPDQIPHSISRSTSNKKKNLQNPDAPALSIELHRQPVAIAPLIDSIYQDIQPLIQQHPALFICHIPKNLPAIDADPTQLWRVLENLVTNAIKHNPPPVEVTLTVSLDSSTSSEQPTLLRCTVQDNGVGIPAADQATLFAPYQRGTEVGQTPGLGLGLYLCQQIIAAHGGEIGVSSQPNNGTTFWFTVPCVLS